MYSEYEIKLYLDCMITQLVLHHVYGHVKPTQTLDEFLDSDNSFHVQDCGNDWEKNGFAQRVKKDAILMSKVYWEQRFKHRITLQQIKVWVN